MTWEEPQSIGHVASYLLFLASDAVGASRSLLGEAIAPRATTYLIPAETAIFTFFGSSYSHVVAYTKSTYAEQTTPAYFALSDASASVLTLGAI